MTVIPSPRASSVVGGRDRAGRALRVTAHPEAGRVVVSTWQERTCVSTVRLAAADVPDLVSALSAAAIACAADPFSPADLFSPTGPPGAAGPAGAAGGARRGDRGAPAPPRPGHDRSGAASGVSAA